MQNKTEIGLIISINLIVAKETKKTEISNQSEAGLSTKLFSEYTHDRVCSSIRVTDFQAFLSIFSVFAGVERILEWLRRYRKFQWGRNWIVSDAMSSWLPFA